MANIIIPSALRLHQSDLPNEFFVEAATVGEAITTLVATHPGMKSALFDDGGKLRSLVRVYVDNNCIDQTGGLGTRVEGTAEIFLLTPIAGG